LIPYFGLTSKLIHGVKYFGDQVLYVGYSKSIGSKTYPYDTSFIMHSKEANYCFASSTTLNPGYTIKTPTYTPISLYSSLININYQLDPQNPGLTLLSLPNANY
jgi:hypothetical protein